MEPGDRLDGRFEIMRRGNAGGICDVYLAKDLRTGDRVALKALNGASAESRKRFETEAHVLRLLQHPAIVRYVHHGLAEGGECYLAMEWLEGEDLASRLATGALSVSESIALMRRVAEALAVAHSAGVVHRDIKPANIFLTAGQLAHAKVVDFGIAVWHRDGDEPRISESAMVGTPGYMSPEQIRCEQTIDARADIYSLGCVWYRALAGREPSSSRDRLSALMHTLFEHPPELKEFRDDVPPRLEALITRMMSKDPSQRPQDGTELLREVLALQRSGPRTAIPATVPSQVPDGAEGIVRVVARAAKGTRREEPVPNLSIRLAVEHAGARLDVIHNEMLLASVPARGTMRERAERALECAARLLEQIPGVRLAVVGPRDDISAAATLADQLERANTLLTLRPTRAVRVDDRVATMLGTPGDLARDDGGLYVPQPLDPEPPLRISLARATATPPTSDEVRALREQLNRCVRVRTSAVTLVFSPQSIELQRLASDVLRGLEDTRAGMEVWVAEPSTDGAGRPWDLLRQTLRSTLGVARTLTGEPFLRALRDRVARRVPVDDRGRILAAFTSLFEQPLPSATPGSQSSLPAWLAPDALVRAWLDFVNAESRVQPVLWVLGGLERADADSLNAAEEAARTVSGGPFFLVGVARPELRDRFPLLWDSANADEIAWGRSPTRSGERVLGRDDADTAPAADVAKR